MGVIQNAVNQAIGTAGIAARLSPELEKAQELRKLEKEENISKQRVSEGMKSLQGKSDAELTPADFELHENLLKQSVDVAKRKFELDPTEENFKTYEKRMQAHGEFKNIQNEFMKSLEQRQVEALDKVEEKKQAQQTQKRNFMSYLSKQQIAGGGTVGQLPTNMLKLIAKQYSPAERKKLMNTMDKENNTNGN